MEVGSGSLIVSTYYHIVENLRGKTFANFAVL